MKMIVGTTTHFDAAHYLPNYNGKCKHMHGHTWHITVEVQGELIPTTGMVVDLTILKKIVNQAIENYDHQLLNDYVGLPTCEILAHMIASFVWTHTRRTSIIAYGGSKETDITNVMVKVQEGEGGWACVTL